MPIRHVPTVVGMGTVAHTVDKTWPKKKRKRAGKAETWRPKGKTAKPKARRSR